MVAVGYIGLFIVIASIATFKHKDASVKRGDFDARP